MSNPFLFSLSSERAVSARLHLVTEMNKTKSFLRIHNQPKHQFRERNKNKSDIQRFDSKEESTNKNRSPSSYLSTTTSK